MTVPPSPKDADTSALPMITSGPGVIVEELEPEGMELIDWEGHLEDLGRQGSHSRQELSDVMGCLQERALMLTHSTLSGPERMPTEVKDRTLTHRLVLPTGPQWREAATAAMLGEWADDIGHETHVYGGMARLRAFTRVAHRRLTPVWRRKTGHGRVLLLDTLLGDGVTLYDLVKDSPSAEEVALGATPDDPRVGKVLDSLDPDERAVALAWAHWQPNSWAEAALLAGAPDPAAYGERVRRKLKRLGERHTARTEAARHAAGGRS
ncbi:hypothetical protein ACFWZ2_43130 [Streptomyces sp. NPDC059002]|uniref:hypothetical protein n=1 Tax=Streptomyces sp. NPDC059002 TaxID=3346690 RepID=UPI0036B022A7